MMTLPQMVGQVKLFFYFRFCDIVQYLGGYTISLFLFCLLIFFCKILSKQSNYINSFLLQGVFPQNPLRSSVCPTYILYLHKFKESSVSRKKVHNFITANASYQRDCGYLYCVDRYVDYISQNVKEEIRKRVQSLWWRSISAYPFQF